MPHYCFYLHLVYKLYSFSVDFVLLPSTWGVCHKAYRRSRVACERCSTKDWKRFLFLLMEFSVETEAFKHSCWKASVVSKTWRENNDIASHLFFYCFSLCNLLLAVYFMLIKQTLFINYTSLDIVSSANMASAKNKVLFWALFNLNFCEAIPMYSVNNKYNVIPLA